MPPPGRADVQRADGPARSAITTSIGDDSWRRDQGEWPSEGMQCNWAGCYPRLFLIGAMKAGTTSVFLALEKAERVCGFSVACQTAARNHTQKGQFSVSPYGDGKEAHLLGVEGAEWSDVMANKWKYTGCYKPVSCSSRHFLDATPDYLSYPAAPGRLERFMPQNWLPEIRIIAVLREPIARALSHYNMATSTGIFPGCITGTASFEEEIDCDRNRAERCFAEELGAPRTTTRALMKASVAVLAAGGDNGPMGYWSCITEHVGDGIEYSILLRGLYLGQLRAWSTPRMQSVKRSQLFAITFKDIIEHTADSMNRIGNFYGLGQVHIPSLPKANDAHTDRADMNSIDPNDRDYGIQTQNFLRSKISCAIRNEMAEFYQEWNDQLMIDMHEAHNAGLVPPQEPWFDGFGETEIECDNGEEEAAQKAALAGPDGSMQPPVGEYDAQPPSDAQAPATTADLSASPPLPAAELSDIAGSDPAEVASDAPASASDVQPPEGPRPASDEAASASGALATVADESASPPPPPADDEQSSDEHALLPQQEASPLDAPPPTNLSIASTELASDPPPEPAGDGRALLAARPKTKKGKPKPARHPDMAAKGKKPKPALALAAVSGRRARHDGRGRHGRLATI